MDNNLKCTEHIETIKTNLLNTIYYIKRNTYILQYVFNI